MQDVDLVGNFLSKRMKNALGKKATRSESVHVPVDCVETNGRVIQFALIL